MHAHMVLVIGSMGRWRMGRWVTWLGVELFGEYLAAAVVPNVVLFGPRPHAPHELLDFRIDPMIVGSVNVSNLVNAVATVDSYVSTGYVDGDVNGDRNADVLFQGSGFNEFGRWILHRGEISHVVEEPSAPNDDVAAVGDLDGDGRADIVWQRTDGTVTVWLSRGEGAYQKTTLGPAPSGASVVAAFDADGDGFADLALVNPSTQATTVWRMVGASKAQTWTEMLPAGAVVHGSADFDKDGLEDLAVTSGNTVSLLLSLPGGNFTTTSLGAMPAGATLIGAEDINDDGARDLVFFNATTRVVTVWFMNDTSAKTVDSWTLPVGETVVGLGDFDADGHADVLTQNQVRHLSFWSRLVAGGFSEHSIGLDAASEVPTRWNVVAAQNH